MKSTKLVYFCSLFCGISLFFLGIFILASMNDTPVLQEQQHVADNSNTPGQTDWLQTYTNRGNPINILVLIKEASGDNTDTIFIANYEPEINQISLLTIPRDTKVSSNGLQKINSLFSEGLRKYKQDKHKAAVYAAQYFSNIANVNIDYYVYFEIDTIKKIIDELGGVYFDVPADLKYSDPTQDLYINLKKGYQLLDGDKSEQLLRFRKPANLSRAPAELRKFYDGSDLKRTEMQVRFIKEFVDQKVSLVNLPKFIPIINYTFANVATNTSLPDMLNLFSGFTKADRPEINTFKLYGLDKRVSELDFFVYINKIEDTRTRDVFASDEIIDRHFKSQSDLFVPKGKKYDYKAILNDNPSNSDTNTVGIGEDIP